MPDGKSRLTREAWIQAGLKALVADGPSVLRAEVMSRRLGTTKGSFYWHFKDVGDFTAALLTEWQAAAHAATTLAMGASGTAPHKLYHFEGLEKTADKALECRGSEPAFRAWAQSDAKVAKAVQEVDARRLSYLSDLLGEMGLTNPDFARIAYAAHIGLVALPETDKAGRADAMSTLMAALLALQDA